jgi:hypothetical protein
MDFMTNIWNKWELRPKGVGIYWWTTSIFLFYYLDGLGSLAGCHSELWNYESCRQLVELFRWGIRPSQGLYLQRTAQKHTKRRQTSLPRVGLEPIIAVSERRHFMSQMARPLWSAHLSFYRMLFILMVKDNSKNNPKDMEHQHVDCS